MCFFGKTLFKPQPADTIPMPSTMQYRNVGASKDTTAVVTETAFNGTIIKVEDGSSIQEAVLKS